MKQRAAAPAASGGFLHTAPAPAYQQSPLPQYYQPAPPTSGGGISGFLHNAATTAAGVLAGEVAFESLSSLFGGHRGAFFGGGGGGFFGGGGGGETIVNNYYDDGGAGGIGGGGADSRFGQAAADSGDQISSDIDDERDSSGDSFVDDSSGGDSFDSGGSDDSGF